MSKLIISPTALYFRQSGFNIWNINKDKCPIIINKDTTTTNITKWQNYGATDFENLKVYYSKNIGFYCGYQHKSKRDIIILDFDIFSKSVKNIKVANLYENFLKIDILNNLHKKGHYNSSTCGNKGVILDITSNKEFCNYIYGLNLSKIAGGLEIIIKGNVVLPPSTTICKNCNEAVHPREFVEDIGITYITPEIEKFIRDYIDTKRKKLPSKHEIRDTKNANKGLIHYNNIITGTSNDDADKPSFECILELIKKTLLHVLNDYQGWFFITSSLINSYGNTDEHFNAYDIICKESNGYSFTENQEFWRTTDTSRYVLYNYKAIIKASNFYDSLLTYCILGEEYKRINKLKNDTIEDEKYQKWKTEFEKTRAKIISPINFLDIVCGQPDFIGLTELRQRYAEYSVFLEKWLKDEHKRCYKKIIFKPNATIQENTDNYNLFDGFSIENVKVDINTNLDIKVILQFINLIAGNKDYKEIDYNNVSLKLVMAFIIKIIKYKDLPKISLVLRSVRRHGCGKGTFYNLLKNIIGSKYCLETSEINDLFGNFNDGRVNKLLIAIDECSGSNTFEVTGKIKNAITESTFMANPKYGKKYQLDNFNTFLFNSNNERCINVEIGNRRIWVIDVPNAESPEYLINFNKEVVENNNYLKLFYDYIVNKAEDEFNINFSTYNFENIIKNYENKSTKNLKQIYAKDTFLMDLYIEVISDFSSKYKNINDDNYSNTDFVVYSNDKNIAYIKASSLYEEYKYFFASRNMSKDGGNCGSNQTFYKSLEFYDFIKCKSVRKINFYMFDIEEFKKWYEMQEDASCFEPATEEELRENDIVINKLDISITEITLPIIKKKEGIYLLKEREFIRMNEDVYKIGRSKNIKQRISSYPKDSKVKLTLYCNNSIKLESLLIKIFKEKFTHMRQYGNEYFEGNLDDMIRVIKDNINSYLK